MTLGAVGLVLEDFDVVRFRKLPVDFRFAISFLVWKSEYNVAIDNCCFAYYG